MAKESLLTSPLYNDLNRPRRSLGRDLTRTRSDSYRVGEDVGSLRNPLKIYVGGCAATFNFESRFVQLVVIHSLAAEQLHGDSHIGAPLTATDRHPEDLI